MAAQKAHKHYYTIGEAAISLNVAIDTIRRWEKAGKIQATRSAGGMRLFPAEEIERLSPIIQQTASLLTVSQAATYLGVSAVTLRRWDRQNKLKPVRALNHERMYNEESLQAFSSSTIPATELVQDTNPVSYIKDIAYEISDNILLTFFGVVAIKRHAPRLLFIAVIALLLVIIGLSQMTSQANTFKQAVIDKAPPTMEELATAFAQAAETHGYTIILYPKDESQTTAAATLPKLSQMQGIRLTNSTWDAASPTNTVQLLDAPNTSDIPTYILSTQMPSTDNTTSPTTSNLSIHAPVAQTSTHISGSAKVSAGQTTSSILVTGMANLATVHITLTSPSSQSVWVSRKIPDTGFTVSIDQAQSQDITFDWFVIP